MKSKMGILVLLAFNLIACGQKEMNFDSLAQASSVKEEDCLDCGSYPIAQYNRLHYFHGGGYPPPHGDSTITDLTLERGEDSLYVSLKTRYCKIEAKISVAYHDKLVYSLSKAKRKAYNPNTPVAADIPYELITLWNEQEYSPNDCIGVAQKIYLKNGDYSQKGQEILEEADAEEIRKQLDQIADEAGRVADKICSPSLY